jgi:G:T-mismatch repair DNA endonuclease (very short patch repair protein)
MLCIKFNANLLFQKLCFWTDEHKKKGRFPKSTRLHFVHSASDSITRRHTSSKVNGKEIPVTGRGGP